MPHPVDKDVMSGLIGKGLSRRGVKGIWQHTRRVPKRYTNLEPRKLIRTSLNTQDLSLAQAKAAQIEILQNQEWELALSQDASVPSYEAAKKVAELRGFSYLPADQIAQLPTHQICDRIELADTQPQATSAILGSVETPKLMTDVWLDTYQGHVEEKLANHSVDQRHRWYLTRVRAVTRFVEAVGPQPVSEITRAQALEFRNWWRERMKTMGRSANTANKDFAYLSGMWSTMAKLEGWSHQNPFSSLAFAENTKARSAFSNDWIQHKLLHPRALAALNEEARDILLLMVNTGARPSELINLKTEHISLGNPIPHVKIRPHNRRLKTKYSERDIPLVGCSLEAALRHPNGFKRYYGKSENWSAATNKHLRQNGLLESDNHSPYSLRHSLSDRLQNAGCEDRTRKEIMGHRPEGIIYGSGSSLETKAKWLGLVGFK